MLAALLLIGLMPLAFAYDDLGNDDAEEHGAGDGPEPDPAGSGGDLLEDAFADEEAETPPAEFSLHAGAGDALLDGFRPGVDSLSIDVTGQAEAFTVDVGSEDGAAILELFEGDAADPGLSVHFAGLSEVPLGDVVIEAIENGETLSMPLVDLLQAAGETAAPGADAGSGLDPVDPDAPDAPGPAESGEGLDPVDPDVPDAPGPSDGAAGLDPVDPEASDTGLNPVDPDDPGGPGPGGEAPGLDPVDPDGPGQPGPDTGNPGLDPVDPEPGHTGLDPVDPDDPGVPGPGGDHPGLDPVDPDDPGLPGPVSDDPGLDPVDPDAPAEPPVAAHGLADLIARDSDMDAGGATAEAETGSSGAEVSMLGQGNDTLDLAADETPGNGAGTLGFDQGSPVISDTAPVAVVDGGGGDDVLTGGDQAAYLFGGEGADIIVAGDGATAGFGGAGDDILSAGPAAAWLDGGAGDDSLSGGAGDDVLFGGSHGAFPAESDDDVIDGGAGDDTLRGGYGSDTLSGGAGDDVIDHHGHSAALSSGGGAQFAWHLDGAADTLSGGAGDDTLIFDGHDTVSGGTGADVFWLHHDNTGPAGVADVTDFETGADFLRISLNPAAGHVDLPELEVGPAQNGADAEVRIDGELVAILRGAVDATVDDVLVEVRPDVFA
jgi:Ca2+-binding RTX toxin-like protein